MFHLEDMLQFMVDYIEDAMPRTPTLHITGINTVLSADKRDTTVPTSIVFAKLIDLVRYMQDDAARQGPQWAGHHDPRVTRCGKILRQLHLDEIPQMINILKADMSLIGPRPERPMFVQKLSQEIPLYQRRLKVRPGLTGWAQVKQKYDETIDDVKKKVQYDLFYIENMSLRMDFKIMLNTAYHVLLGRGR